jgi:hypothetical protein
MPAQRKLTLPDHELLDRLEQGETPAEIAKEFRCTAEAVRNRARVCRENLCAPAARRAEEVVASTLDAFALLGENLDTLRQLKQAAERLLQNPDGPGFDVGPHDYDLEVITAAGGGPPVRRPLREILKGDAFLVSVEGRFADPRTYLVSLCREIRSEIEVGVRLAERLHDLESVERFQQEVLDAIDQADATTAARIRGALHERRTLRLALRPPGR